MEQTACCSLEDAVTGTEYMALARLHCMELGSGISVDIAKADTGAGRLDLAIALDALISQLLQPGSLLLGFLVIPTISGEYKF